MRNPQGTLIITDPNAPLVEVDTITCCHCQRIVLIKPKCDPSEAGGFCMMCFRHLCGPCADKGVCTPFEKKLEQIERRDNLLRSIGM